MKKNKIRKYPQKYQNQLGDICQHSEKSSEGIRCELGYNISICGGNPHNCCKVKYKLNAIRRKNG